MNASFQYLLFFKPYGVLSQFSKEGDHPTLKDYLDIDTDIYPVGRLDRDSEGLLLLTNDKKVNQALLHPSQEKSKVYWVQVEGDITAEAIAQLRKGGVVISHKGKKHTCAPAEVQKLNAPDLPERTPPVRFRKNIPTSWISLTIQEGKNRQVRKMTAAVGFPTLRLVRYQIQKAKLDGLAPGAFKSLSPEEFRRLFQ